MYRDPQSAAESLVSYFVGCRMYQTAIIHQTEPLKAIEQRDVILDGVDSPGSVCVR